jgi:hypothetical protein
VQTRYGFVSNSSSTNFIVIAAGKQTAQTPTSTYIIGEEGHSTFGWAFNKYDDVHSKINFAWIQAKYAEKDHPEWMKMLEVVIAEAFQANSIECKLSLEFDEENKRYAYIDHQSAYCDDKNCEMFDSMENLEQFLFCPNSYIQGGNDNT